MFGLVFRVCELISHRECKTEAVDLRAALRISRVEVVNCKAASAESIAYSIQLEAKLLKLEYRIEDRDRHITVLNKKLNKLKNGHADIGKEL